MRGWRRGILVVGILLASAVVVVAAVVVAGGSSEPSPPNDQSHVDDQPDTTDTQNPAQAADDCGFPPGEPFVGGPSATAIDLGGVNDIRVEGVVYPRPDYQGNPWSQWGQGIALRDGRFISAIGDHFAVGGNSYIYEYDPDTGTLGTLGDLLSYVDYEPRSWGYGKVHGQMVAGLCDEIYFSSYWGSARDLQFDGSYQGDILFRLDPELRTIAALSVPVQEHGVPSLAGSSTNRLVYGEAIDPLRLSDEVEEGPFFVYDTVAGQVIFDGPSTPHFGFRSIMVDAEGRAYYSLGEGKLAVYDPEQNDITTLAATMPGYWLRASTIPAADGRVFGVTEEEQTFFVLQPSGEIETLGQARGYTTSMALHPDGERFFYIPDAHGSAWSSGAPLISVDTRSGEETVIAELNPMVEAQLGLRLGGTYNIVVDPSGEIVYIGMNAGPLGAEDGFGEVVLLVVHLP